MMDLTGAEASALAGLGATAFLAATLLPLSSEVMLLALVALETAPIWALFTAASIGNTAGSCVNWALGRYLETWRERRWFPLNERQLERAQVSFNRWGWPSLLLSWVPVIGDPLTVAAGLMRTPFWLFLAVVAAAKSARYAVLLWLTS